MNMSEMIPGICRVSEITKIKRNILGQRTRRSRNKNSAVPRNCFEEHRRIAKNEADFDKKNETLKGVTNQEMKQPYLEKVCLTPPGNKLN